MTELLVQETAPSYAVTVVFHFDTATRRDEWLRQNACALADSAVDAETLRLAQEAIQGA